MNKTRRIGAWTAAMGLALAVAAVSVTRGQDGPPNQPPMPHERPTTRPGGPRNGPPVQSLEQNMHAMSRDFKTLRGQGADSSKNESSIKIIGDMERATVIAKGQLPGMINTLDKADQPKAIAGYRATMLKLLKDEITFEEQITDGKNEDAAKTLNEMKAVEDEGHQAYRPPDN